MNIRISSFAFLISVLSACFSMTSHAEPLSMPAMPSLQSIKLPQLSTKAEGFNVASNRILIQVPANDSSEQQWLTGEPTYGFSETCAVNMTNVFVEGEERFGHNFLVVHCHSDGKNISGVHKIHVILKNFEKRELAQRAMIELSNTKSKVQICKPHFFATLKTGEANLFCEGYDQ